MNRGHGGSRPFKRQLNGGMTPGRMLDDLPTRCDVGTKRNAKGHQVSWTGYKLHIDCADGDIPVSCILVLTVEQLMRIAA